MEEIDDEAQGSVCPSLFPSGYKGLIRSGEITETMLPPVLVGLYELSALALILLFPLLLLLIWRRGLSPESRRRRLPPSPPRLPIIGNLHQMGPLPHRSLHALSQEYGNLMLLYLGRVPTLVASSADEAREIMKTHDIVFATRPRLEMAQVLLYRGVDMGFAPYGEHWRQVRKICVTHLFSGRMVEYFRLSREEEVDFTIQKVSSHVGAAADMSEILYFFANNILCRVVSGKYRIREEGRTHMFRELIEEGGALLGAFYVGDYLPGLAWMGVFFGLGARAKRVAKRWDDLLEQVIREHAIRSGGDRPEDTDFIDVLLSLQKDPNMDFVLTKEHIKAILMDMFLAGIETTYVVLEWAMAELARNPNSMKKLQNEVRGIAGGKCKVREEDLHEMGYLKAVIKEVLRLHPPVPLSIPRESMDDCEIGIYKVSKHTRVIINVWAIGRDPRFWEAPEEFRPERFTGTPVDFKGIDFQFIPFGAGRRICPGMKSAVLTTELGLANLMHRFDWELPDGLTTENLDMDEAPGSTTRRKHRLHLVAKPYSYVSTEGDI